MFLKDVELNKWKINDSNKSRVTFEGEEKFYHPVKASGQRSPNLFTNSKKARRVG